VLDTRTGLGAGGVVGKVGPGRTLVLDVTGRGGVPATGVASIAINVTVTGPTATSFVSVTPSGGSGTSTLNFVRGQTVPNLVVVPVGPDGSIRLYNAAGSTHLIGDITGWFAGPDATVGSHFVPTGPARLLDTRTGLGRNGVVGPVGGGSTIVLGVAGLGAIPSEGVRAVAVNVTVTGPTAAGYLSVTPSGGGATSSVNFAAGETAANLVMVKTGADGSVRIRNATGTAHVVVDVVGWFSDPGLLTGAVQVPVEPARVLDTRDGTGRGGVTGKIGPSVPVVLDVTGVGGVPTSGASAVILNVTAVAPSANGYLSVTPSGGLGTSTLNFARGETVANLVVVPIGPDGSVQIANAAGATHVVGDVVGWFTSPGVAPSA
jgi:hypothetical protein